MTSGRRDYRPGPLQHVELSSDGRRWALTFARTFAHPPAAVWSALTVPDEQQRWAPYRTGRPLDSIGPATMVMLGGDGTELDATVSALDPPNLLEHAWDADVLRWHLADEHGNTRLTLVHHTADRSMAGMLAAGWHICLDMADDRLAGGSLGPIVGGDALDYGWTGLNAEYSERLGVERRDPPGLQ